MVLQSYYILRHVSVVATTIFRERPQTVQSYKQRCYKAQFVLLCIQNRIHFTVSISVELGNRWVCGGAENLTDVPPML
jgi:hypothetical protein